MGSIAHFDPGLEQPRLCGSGFPPAQQRRNATGLPSRTALLVGQVVFRYEECRDQTDWIAKMNGILQDWKANHGNPKGRFVMVFFRLCQQIRNSSLWPVGVPVLGSYVILVHWIMGIELDYRTEVGPGLSLQHGTGLVVHQRCKIGAGCTLRHGVTLGERVKNGPVPVLADGVEMGANAVVLGGVFLGSGSVVGAGSIVLHDVPAGAVVAGNPAKIVRQNS